MLELIADHDGLSASDVVRQLVRQRYTQLGPDVTGLVEKANWTARTVDKIMDPVRQLEKATAPITKTQKQLKSALPKIPKPKR